MFCRNCGSKTLVGDYFCVTCGQAQRPASASESAAGPALEEPETPAEESNLAEAVSSAAPVDRTVPVRQPGEQSLFCRHSPSERTTLGVDTTGGSEICRGCRLPYAPGSPNSRTEGDIQEQYCNVASGEKPVRRSLSGGAEMGVQGPQPAAGSVGIGSYGRKDQALIERAQKGLGANLAALGRDPGKILLAFKCGRAKGYGISLPAGSRDSLAVLTTKIWAVLSRDGSLLASGPIDEVRWTKSHSDGFRMELSCDRAVRFVITGMGPRSAEQPVRLAVGRALLARTTAVVVAPHQEPVCVEGNYAGGYGTGLTVGGPASLTVDGAGIAIMTPHASLVLPVEELIAVQMGGMGEYQTGGGWFGGGIGVKGALEGAAFATVMNWMTTSSRIDCVVRLVFREAEATFSVKSHTPAQLELQLAALLAALRGSSGPLLQSSTLGLTSVGEAKSREPRGPGPQDTMGFCPGCGARRQSGASFCVGCGNPLS
jgi:hypothetical protein